MIKSMTGYGKAQISEEHLDIYVEVKSVNHKNRDLRIRMPYKLNPIEMDLRRHVEKKVNRGSIDLNINYEDFSEEADLKLDLNAAKSYLNIYQAIEDLCQEKLGSKSALLARNNNLFIKSESAIDESRLLPIFTKALEQALEEFDQSRLQEGQNLKNDLLKRAAYMTDLLERISAYAGQVVDYYRDRLLDRLSDLLNEQLEEFYDGQRVAAEMVIIADKADITEEITRLHSHLDQFVLLIKEGGPVGKNLDFLIQEILRETNTIGSKANFLEITKLVVEMKTNIEKVREQVQNIE